jgi:hypothetical protein
MQMSFEPPQDADNGQRLVAYQPPDRDMLPLLSRHY